MFPHCRLHLQPVKIFPWGTHVGFEDQLVIGGLQVVSDILPMINHALAALLWIVSKEQPQVCAVRIRAAASLSCEVAAAAAHAVIVHDACVSLRSSSDSMCSHSPASAAPPQNVHMIWALAEPP